MAKKKINSKAKGNRAELALAKILTEHFGIPFARVGVASGARVKNTKLPGNAVGVMTSDIIVPPRFKFAIECKSVNIDIDFFDISIPFERWLAQATEDATSIGKLPMVCWKRPHKGWLVAVPARAFKDAGIYGAYYIRYASDTPHWRWGWIVLRLEALLEANQDEEDFWFETDEEKEERNE